MERVKVLYIGGFTRSGSTLLGQMLGQVNGFFHSGELHSIWRNGFIENHLCSCGNPFNSCQFWQLVVEEAFGKGHDFDVTRIQSIHLATARLRYWPLLACPFLRTRRFHERLGAYLKILSRLYQAIQKVAGSEFLVDSSKDPSFGYILNMIPEVDLYILHLVRDSRAAAYSWQRQIVRPHIYWKKDYMDQYSPFWTAIFWTITNGLTETCKYVNPNYLWIRYDDVVDEPITSLKRILSYLRHPTANLDFLIDQTVDLKLGHTVSGNPVRFQHGLVKVQPDNEWEEKLPRLHKLAVTVLTWPMLLNYGFWFLKSTRQNSHTGKA